MHRQQEVLSACRVADLARAALSRADPLEVTAIHEGGEHLSWFVGREYVARFVTDQRSADRQQREIELRDLVRDRVTVPVPRSAAVGGTPGLRFTLDERLPGISAERRPVGERGERDLAALLTGLRCVSTVDAADLGVPRQEPHRLSELREQAVAAAERMTGNGQLDGPILPWAPLPHEAMPVLVHADLKGEHLLVDGDGAISGVIDWTDAEIGDPATDIAGLAISIGSPAALRVAERACYDAATRERGIFLARCNTLILLDDRLNGTDDSPEPLLRAQLTRAWHTSPSGAVSGEWSGRTTRHSRFSAGSVDGGEQGVEGRRAE
ncbi:aminoglycoside phosphotransferase family protein [Pseudonocardia spinosispora]|uniref:aminoglycoside phosphotransferase family protein n=1 Tax=Pseudonocardia spinosispora TaxID=103441 RepID=UPI00146FA9CE|nr:aminoglycoside phosphotransferase family protein [Pseudonocardia spinosispora]